MRVVSIHLGYTVKLDPKSGNLMEVQLRDETKSFEMNSQYAFTEKNAVILDTELLCGSRPGNK
jgi:hypothetical protein